MRNFTGIFAILNAIFKAHLILMKIEETHSKALKKYRKFHSKPKVKMHHTN
jgi:hypothetical protein